MDSCDSQEKLDQLKRINDQNEEALRNLGIDMCSLPDNIKSMIDEFVDTQQMTGLHELDLNSLELWHLHQREEVVNLEDGVLKPLQRKFKKVNEEVDAVTKKIDLFEETISDFKKGVIPEGEYMDRVHEIESDIKVAEKAIMDMPEPSVLIDHNKLIDQVNAANAEQKLKRKNSTKKH